VTADAQWLAFVAKVFTANPSGTLISGALATEITP